MLRRSIKHLFASGVIAALCIAGSGAAHADSQAPVPPGVKHLVEEAFVRPLTSVERQLLIREYPEVAASVPDIASSSTQVIQTAQTRSLAAVPTATKCNTYSGWATMKSLLGFTLYKFTHKATACSNGAKVTSHTQPTFTLDNVDPTVDNWNVVDKSVSGVNTATSTSRIQVRVQQCVVKAGCYALHYPVGTIAAKANNTATITTAPR